MNVNFKRWVVVGFLAVMILFSFFHLSSAGTDYKILTTSDSGFFYGIARETNEMNGLPDTYELSHPPQGRPVKGNVQFQPLMLTMFYRGLNFLDSGISLMTACQYFSPFIFTLALIGAFLAGRELGGNISGGASVLFMSTLIGSIYWTKIGAFDREISLMLFGAWMFYFLVKIFKARKDEIWKYSILSGLVYGLFLLTWQGALFIAAIPVGALILILLIRFPSSYTSSENIEEAIITDFNKTKHLIAGIIAMFVISTGIAITIGGYSPDFWAGFVQKILGFFGVGGTGGLGSPLVATEQQVPQNYLASLSGQLYRSIILTRLTIIFVAFAVLKVMWTRKKKELLLIFALIVPAAMATSQSRFFRIFWPIWPILAAYGVWSIFWTVRRLLVSPSFMDSEWIGKLKQPLVISLILIAFITPFIQNARANATETQPTPHGGTRPAVYHSLIDSYSWIKDNTSENSVIAVEWSYGHLLTGFTNRKSVTDGAQTQRIWENKQLPPPDYVKLDVNNDGKITSADDTDGDGEWESAGGRRSDVQSLYNKDREGFESIVQTYRDNYGLQMDYIVFNLFRTTNSLMGMWNPQAPQTNSVTQDNQNNYVFAFEGENIVLNNQQGLAYTQDDKEYLGGVIYYYAQNNSFSYNFYPGSPEVQKVLWLLVGEGGQLAGKLTDYKGIPMVIRAERGYSMPEYLEKTYSSPHNFADVYKIHHTPDLITPIENNSVNDNYPYFQWSSIPGEGRYRLEVDDNPDFSSPNITQEIESTKFKSNTLLSDGTYYWRVKSYNNENDSLGWSNVESFRVDTIPPNSTTLSSPSDGLSINDNKPTFEWSEVEEAESYRIQVDNNEDFNSPEIQTIITSDNYSPEEPLSDGNYWWRVQTIDEAGNESSWTPEWEFNIQT